MDDGSSLNRGVRIATNCFTLEEVNLLCNVLKLKYNIIATPKKCGRNNNHIIYIHAKSMKLFINIIKPYLLPSLYYKLESYKYLTLLLPILNKRSIIKKLHSRIIKN